MDRHKMFYEGKMLWHEYVQVNGYAFEPSAEGIAKLSKLLDLSKSFIRKCIYVFLSA